MGNADLVRDMIRLTGEQNKRGRGDLSFLVWPWEMPRCQFHSHAVGAECDYTSRTI
jgi:hypothetical protein